MPSWPDVVPGGEIEHHALLENQLRRMVNSVNGFMGGIQRATSGGVVRVQIWNAGIEAFVAGQPVAFDNTKDICGEALPAVPVTDPSKPWGVCVNLLEPMAMGDCIVAGPAKVTLTGDSGDYAKPEGTVFVRGTGTARVLHCDAEGKAVILLGGTGGGGSLGVISMRPSGGSGPATWKMVTLNADGSWTATGDDIAVIIPRY